MGTMLLERMLSLRVGELSLLVRKIKRVADLVDCLNLPDLAKRNLSFSSLEQVRLNCRKIKSDLAKRNLSFQELSQLDDLLILSFWRLLHPTDCDIGGHPLISRPVDLEKWKHERVIHKLVIRVPPADLEEWKLMRWIRHTQSISCLEQFDIGRLNMSARNYKVHFPNRLFFRKRKLMSDLAKKNLSFGKLKRSFKTVKRLAGRLDDVLLRTKSGSRRLLARKLLESELSLLEKRVADLADCLPDLAKRNLSSRELRQLADLLSFSFGGLPHWAECFNGLKHYSSRLADLEKRSHKLFLSIMVSPKLERLARQVDLLIHQGNPRKLSLLERKQSLLEKRRADLADCLNYPDLAKRNLSSGELRQLADLLSFSFEGLPHLTNYVIGLQQHSSRLADLEKSSHKPFLSLMEIAEPYEQEQNLEQTIVYYERAADLFQSGCHTSANQCRQKIALEQYPKAIEIYEDIARQLLNNNLLKYGVKGHLLNAAYASYVRVMLWQSIMHWSDIRSSIQPSQEHGNTDKPQLK